MEGLGHTGTDYSFMLAAMSAALSRTMLPDWPVSRRLFRSQSTMAKPSVVDTASAAAFPPLNPSTRTSTFVEDLPFALNRRVTALPSDHTKEISSPSTKRVTSTVSVAPGTRNSQSTFAPTPRGALARLSQNFLSSAGCTNALKTDKTGLRMSISERAITGICGFQ
jgi:hypothetical protein